MAGWNYQGSELSSGCVFLVLVICYVISFRRSHHHLLRRTLQGSVMLIIFFVPFFNSASGISFAAIKLNLCLQLTA